MDLPKKDKYGRNIISYSQIDLFKRDKDSYYRRYIEGEKFVGNCYTDFGISVGKSLETNDFSNFDYIEQETLKKVTRLDVFERPVFLRYNDFYLVGYIDTCDFNLKEIIDYKTGGKKKEFKYMDDDYIQMQIYALAIKQENGSPPRKASVEFIRRIGNVYKGERLMVGEEEPIKINIDISHNRLLDVYSDIYRTAEEISIFYKKNK